MNEKPQETPIKDEPKPNPTQEIPDPEVTENPSPSTTEITKPPDSKPSLAKRRLDTSLDGVYWQCTEKHGRRFRVKTTKFEKEDEFRDSWDNIFHIERTQEQRKRD